MIDNVPMINGATMIDDAMVPMMIDDVPMMIDDATVRQLSTMSRRSICHQL